MTPLTKTCRACTSEIPAKATRCPQCRKDLRRFYRRHKITTAAPLVLIALVIVMSSSMAQVNHLAEQDAQAVIHAHPTIVPSAALVAAYDRNHLTADKTYSGHVVQTTARIGDISSVLGNAYLVLIPLHSDSSTLMNCSVDTAAPLLTLSNGQTVTVRGRMDTMSIGIIALHHCLVVHP